ncbi:MAG: hypothetical protein J0H15_07510 [Xanthomonadales bacterium]|nr:hypothetical protein [Xanthomonadales bacterium]
MNPSTLLRATALLTLLAAPAAEAAVCRVAPDGNGSGTSWASPMALQTALADDTCNEVWIRKGLYKPVLPANINNPTVDERKQSFVVRAGVRVYGGFNGTESLRDQRDPQAHRSVLSGDIDDNDTTDGDGIVADADSARHGNSYHVVVMDGGTARGPLTRGTVLDGVVITAGRANGGSADRFDRGGGLLCRAVNTGQECSPTLRDVLFSGNYAGSGGGAMYNLGVSGGISRPLLNRVRLAGNKASDGGAMYNDGGNAGRADPELLDAEFTGNRAASEGGAIYNNGKQGRSSPRLDRVGFSGNSATYGGAMYNDASSSGTTRVDLANATFAGNNASSDGGAIYNYASSTGDTRMTLAHVTFSGNAAARGGAIFNSGSSANPDNAGPILHGAILWGDSANNAGPEIHNQGAAPKIHDSLVQGGCPTGAQCSGLITANPALGALADNGGFSRTLLPNTGSPAINAAASTYCPLADQRGVPRAQGTKCDIGAVEVEVPACHVKHDASGGNTGSSWANAYTRLQDALANAGCGEIRVAKGIYTPTDGTDTTISFDIRPGQRVYGGFAGTEMHLDQRDPAAHRTVLSGDIGRDDVTDADGIVVERTDRRGSNSQRIVSMDGTTAAGSISANTVLDGFAITGAAFDAFGAGLHCDGSGPGNECSPTLRNLLFSANSGDMGGGIYNAGSNGGRASPTLVNVTFRNNAANYGGGGMYNGGENGGDSSPALINVTFSGNWGMAMYNGASTNGTSSPLLNHVTFHGNIDRFTAASMHNDARFDGTSEPILTNVILWGGTFTLPEDAGECSGGSHVEICNWFATPTIRASLIAGGCPAGAICGPDVRDLDPLLAPLADNGGVGPTLMPAVESPAIDAAADDICAETDQRGISRPQGTRCDIGAVEVVDDRIFANGFE